MREALVAGLGIGMRPTRDIAPQLASGELKVILPKYRGSSNMAIYAVYPCRDYLPEKVNVFIDFLASLFANEQWARDIASIGQAETTAKPRAPSHALPAVAKLQRRGPSATAAN